MSISKAGFLFSFSRKTGELIAEIEKIPGAGVNRAVQSLGVAPLSLASVANAFGPAIQYRPCSEHKAPDALLKYRTNKRPVLAASR